MTFAALTQPVFRCIIPLKKGMHFSGMRPDMSHRFLLSLAHVRAIGVVIGKGALVAVGRQRVDAAGCTHRDQAAVGRRIQPANSSAGVLLLPCDLAGGVKHRQRAVGRVFIHNRQERAVQQLSGKIRTAAS